MYIYTIKDGKANLVAQNTEYEQIITQETFPAKIEHPNTHAVLSYNETEGIYWEYIPYTAKEIREHKYETEKNITFDGELLTVDGANDLWLKYQAEGDIVKTNQLTEIISAKKAEIREDYPDE